MSNNSWFYIAPIMTIVVFLFGRCLVTMVDRKIHVRFEKAHEFLVLLSTIGTAVAFGALLCKESFLGVAELFGRDGFYNCIMAVIAIVLVATLYWVLQLVSIIGGINVQARHLRKLRSTPPEPAPEVDRTVGFHEPPNTVIEPRYPHI